MRKTLFEIGTDLIALDEFLDENFVGGEIPGAAAEMLEAWFGGLAAAEGEKLDAYVNLIRQLEFEARAAEAEARAWSQKADARDARKNWLKRRLQEHLERTGRAKAETASGRVVALQPNGGAVPVELAADAEEVAPPEFVRIVRSIDKEAVRKVLEDGVELPFAKLGERGRHLRIR